MKKILFWVGVLIAVFAPVPLAIWLDSAKFGVLCFVSGTLSVLFSRIDLLQELSVGPLKAKLREAISEAHATVDQLRALGTELSNVTLSLLISTEFMGGMDIKEKFELHRKIIACLDDLGVSTAQIESSQANWVKGVSVMYCRLIRKCIEGRESPSHINLNAPENDLKASKEINEISKTGAWDVMSPADMRGVLQKHSVSNSEAEEWINDYEEFLKTKSIPRLVIFLKSQR